MTTEVLRKTPEPPKLRIGLLVAVTLELAMFCIFVHHKSLLGVLVWFLYAWFSATWSLILDLVASIDD